jgi:hypothetical protein
MMRSNQHELRAVRKRRNDNGRAEFGCGSIGATLAQSAIAFENRANPPAGKFSRVRSRFERFQL